MSTAIIDYRTFDEPSIVGMASSSRTGRKEDIESSGDSRIPLVASGTSSARDSERPPSVSEESSLVDEMPVEGGPNRPSGVAWRQQKLVAWQPILTANTVLPAFFLLGVAFIPVGIGLLIASKSVQEVVVPYTDCSPFNDPKVKCSDLIQNWYKTPSRGQRPPCTCRVSFTLTEDMTSPVYVYYGLSNFYQNHRRYVKSRDDSQLYGYEYSLTDDCDPYKMTADGKRYAPCGAIARSLFNDEFRLFYKLANYPDPRGYQINMLSTGIAWSTDKAYKFRNPVRWNKTRYVRPELWEKDVWELDKYDDANNGYQNERFIIWMRSAALPTFRKLWARINHDQPAIVNKKLPKGDYLLEVDYKYMMVLNRYRGEKRFILSNTSWIGGRNDFLGIMYIIVGGVCLVCWAVFLFIVRKYTKRPHDVVDFGAETPYTS